MCQSLLRRQIFVPSSSSKSRSVAINLGISRARETSALPLCSSPRFFWTSVPVSRSSVQFTPRLQLSIQSCEAGRRIAQLHGHQAARPSSSGCRHITTALRRPLVRQFPGPLISPLLGSALISTHTTAMTPPPSKKHRVAIIGSGNWGTTIAKVVAENTRENPDMFEEEVQMWVFEENVQLDKKSKHYREGSALSAGPQKLTKLINELHENVKYLADIALPTNLIANPDLVDTVRDATILVFNLPHQFINKTCDDLRGHVVPFARGISCIKGVEVTDRSCRLFSDTIGERLGIYCGALSGANIANEVALEKFSETTIAYAPPALDSHEEGASTTTAKASTTSAAGLHPLPAEYPEVCHDSIKKLFHRPYFHVRLTDDVAGVSLGGALKNIVALGAGFVDGLGWGDNAKAAIMRVGIMEEVSFGRTFFGDSCRPQTFTEESSGIADLITSSAGGRNFRCAKMSVQEGIDIHEIEKRELNGQKLQGTSTAAEVNIFLKAQGKEKDFPLFTAIHRILQGEARPEELPELLEPSRRTSKL